MAQTQIKDREIVADEGPVPARLDWVDSGRLGFIELSTSIAISAEVPGALPSGVNALTTRMRLPGGEVSVASLERMVGSDRLEHATRELADGGATVVSFACTTGSLIKGAGFDTELVARMEAAADVRASTTATALLSALASLGVERLAVVTPYVDALNDLEKRFLEDNGFGVVAMGGLGIDSDREIARVPYQRTLELARAADRSDADAVFISCTNLPTLALLDGLEEELGKPVLSSVAVTIHHALSLAGIAPSASGAGSLLAGRDIRPATELSQ